MNSKKMYLVLMVMGVLVSCSHTTQEQVQLDSKLEAESGVDNYSALANEAKTTIESTSDLSEAKKKDLVDLKINTVRQLEELQKDILKNKTILLKNILSDRYSKKEVMLIEKRIIHLADKKNEIFFSALEKAKNIVSGVRDKEALLQKLRFDSETRFIREGSTGRGSH